MISKYIIGTLTIEKTAEKSVRQKQKEVTPCILIFNQLLNLLEEYAWVNKKNGTVSKAQQIAIEKA